MKAHSEYHKESTQLKGSMTLYPKPAKKGLPGIRKNSQNYQESAMMEYSFYKTADMQYLC